MLAVGVNTAVYASYLRELKMSSRIEGGGGVSGGVVLGGSLYDRIRTCGSLVTQLSAEWSVLRHGLT